MELVKMTIWRVVVLIAVIIWTCAWANAQNSLPYLGGNTRPSIGGTQGTTLMPTPRLEGGLITDAPRHYGPTGKACITVHGDAHSQAINPHIFEHIVSATNACAQLIKMQVCYYKSDHCIQMTVPAYSKSEIVLGIMPAMKDFRYEYREKFQ